MEGETKRKKAIFAYLITLCIMATPDRQFTRTQVEDKLSKAVGKTLLELDTKNLFTFIKDKGIAGKIVEECVLGCKHDSKQAADIDVDGVSTEIKTTGLRLVDTLRLT